MSKARLIITAVVLEGRSQRSVARDYGVSEGRVSKLVTRYRTEGELAYQPRSRRPHTSPATTPATTVALILELRRTLTSAGPDAGADTIAWHLDHHHQLTVSRATIYRTLRNANTITPAPKKKPKTSYIPPRRPIPRPPRPHQQRQSHPPHQRRTPPHRPRTTPQRNPHHRPHPRPRHPHHPRRHRRNPPHPHHQPRTPLPRHRPTPRRPKRTPKKQETRTLMRVRDLPMSRDITWSG